MNIYSNLRYGLINSLWYKIPKKSYVPELETVDALPESVRHCCSSTSISVSIVGIGFISMPEKQQAKEKDAVTSIAPRVPNWESIHSTKGAIMTVPNPVPHL